MGHLTNLVGVYGTLQPKGKGESSMFGKPRCSEIANVNFPWLKSIDMAPFRQILEDRVAEEGVVGHKPTKPFKADGPRSAEKLAGDEFTEAWKPEKDKGHL
jgi:hypothetical protein